MLTRKQFKQLCEQSTLNSIYLEDYENNLNIHPLTVQSFFDTYIDSLMIEYIENNPDATNKQRDNHYYSILDNFNVNDAFKFYKYGLSYDALPRNRFDGVYNLSDYHGYLFYEYNYKYIESAYFYFNTDNHLVIKNFRKNIIRIDSDGDYYIYKTIKNKKIKLYLDKLEHTTNHHIIRNY